MHRPVAGLRAGGVARTDEAHGDRAPHARPRRQSRQQKRHHQLQKRYLISLPWPSQGLRRENLGNIRGLRRYAGDDCAPHARPRRQSRQQKCHHQLLSLPQSVAHSPCPSASHSLTHSVPQSVPHSLCQSLTHSISHSPTTDSLTVCASYVPQ